MAHYGLTDTEQKVIRFEVHLVQFELKLDCLRHWRADGPQIPRKLQILLQGAWSLRRLITNLFCLPMMLFALPILHDEPSCMPPLSPLITWLPVRGVWWR